MLLNDQQSLFVSPELQAFRATLRRFVDQQVKPVASQWERDGHIPREMLQRMGALGWLGLRYPQVYGGSDLNALASVILAEELGRSTFGGFAITVLTQSDTASPHIASAGR